MINRKGIPINQKRGSERGRKVWILKDENGKVVAEFSQNLNAILFKKHYFKELTLERKTPERKR